MVELKSLLNISVVLIMEVQALPGASCFKDPYKDTKRWHHLAFRGIYILREDSCGRPVSGTVSVVIGFSHLRLNKCMLNFFMYFFHLFILEL